ncbi:MAG TPA: lipoyl(octanoyl) transferase LipB [Isosphaeraceae bacterium]|jgi:lipoyl(octanoyl) transferase|nr:lipoyl(octanoyl) transferase LipB [Isosphaeraceae bacterium]
MLRSPLPPPLEIYLLGTIEFEDAQQLQRRLVYDLGEDGGGGALVLCEHPPTFTVGRSGSRFHIVPDDDELRDREIRVHWVNRGGGCVLHLPGQLAGYLALPLHRVGLNLKTYVDGLHSALGSALEEFDLPSSTRTDAPGLFLGEARVASVGIAVNRWIAYYGFTLNVGPYLEPFDLLEEPGGNLLPIRQTSMEARRQRPAPMAKVREAVVRQLELTFGLERHHIYTEHPLIRRKARPHVYVQSYG